MRSKPGFAAPATLPGAALAWLLLAGVVLLAACARGAALPADGSTAPDLVAAAPEGAAGRALQAAAAAYQQSSGLRVRVELYADREYTSTISAALLAGLPSFDLLYLPAEALPRWAGYGALRPITAGFERQPLDPWLPALTIDGQLYGLPAQPNPLVVWFRADWHETAGLPQPARDWQTFRANAQALNEPPTRYGAAVAAGSEDAGLEFAALLEGYGVQAVGNPPGYAVQLDSPEARQALAFYAGLITDGITPPGSENATRSDVIRALREGQAALGIAPLFSEPPLLDCLQAEQPAESACVGLAVSRLPESRLKASGSQVMLGDLSAWAVPQHAAHPLAAERFAAWLVSAEGARAWAEGGGLPAHRALLANLPAGAPPLPGELARELSEIQTYRMVFPPVRNSDLLWQALHSVAHEAAADAAVADAAVADAAEEMRLVLRQGGFIPSIGEEK